MKTLTLKNKFQTNATLVANDFIDNYMIQANGEFVKVYLFLLRHLDDPCSSLTISTIADCLNNTENDILRAFRYWESEGLLTLETDSEGRVAGVELEQTFAMASKGCAGTKSAPADKADSPLLEIKPAIVQALLRTSPKPSLQPYESQRGFQAGYQTGGQTELQAGNQAAFQIDSHTELQAGNQAFQTGSQTELQAGNQAAFQSPLTGNLPAARRFQENTAAPGTKTKAIPLTSFKAQKELKSLFFIAEQYLGKTLSRTDVDAITYFYETLGMSADLIEYLIESCVENGHKSIHYIQKVALSWSDNGVSCVEQAKLHSQAYNKNCYTVLNAFGIKNRGPAASELSHIKKWTEEFGFSLDIIQEACSRTIAATHQPSFEYADTILTKWNEHQIRHLKDIAVLDAAYQKEKSARKPADIKQKPVSKNLNNFERRSYDMDSLEEKLLNSK